MPPWVVPNSKTAQFHPITLNANCGRFHSLSELDSSLRSGRIEWNANRVSRVVVTISRTSYQDQTPEMSQKGSLTFIEGQLCEKPDRQRRLDESAENDVESQTQDSS